MSDKPNSGHRARMMERFEHEGMSLANMFPHEALEVFLFLLIPRVNTNHIAHELIERFGSIDGVFHASVEEITEIRGISGKTAAALKLFCEVYDRSDIPVLLKDDEIASKD